MPTKRLGDRAFGLVVAALFFAIVVIGWLATDRIQLWALGIGDLLMVTALLAPGLLTPLNRLATWFAGWIGQRIAILTNHVLVGIFFFY